MSSTKNIVFSGTFLTINDTAIIIDDFKDIIPEETYTFTENKRVHIYKFSYFDNFLKVTFGDGSATPRNPNIFDIERMESIPNPRKPNQAEPRETFGLLDFNTGLLWLSNSKKQNSIIMFFRSKFKKSKVIAKDVYDEEIFISSLAKLDDIRVSAVPNLLSQTNILSESLSEEINGYEATVASLHFHYQDKFVGDNLIKKIRSIFASRNNFKGIVISGRDERNLGMLFNVDGFSRKIDFKALIDENEMYVPQDVFTKLIDKIRDENI